MRVHFRADRDQEVGRRIITNCDLSQDVGGVEDRELNSTNGGGWRVDYPQREAEFRPTPDTLAKVSS